MRREERVARVCVCERRECVGVDVAEGRREEEGETEGGREKDGGTVYIHVSECNFVRFSVISI